MFLYNYTSSGTSVFIFLCIDFFPRKHTGVWADFYVLFNNAVTYAGKEMCLHIMFISNQTAITSKKRQTVTCRSAFDVEEEVVPLQCFYILRVDQRDKFWSSININFCPYLSGFGCAHNPRLWPNSCLFFFVFHFKKGKISP